MIAWAGEGDFRVKVRNQGRRDAVAVDLRIYLSFHTEVAEEQFTLLLRSRHLDSLGGSSSRERREWWTHLRPEGVPPDHLDAVQDHLPSWAYVDLAAGRPLDLDRLLSDSEGGPDAVVVVVVAEDSFSGARQTARTELAHDAIVRGVFLPGSLEIEPVPANKT